MYISWKIFACSKFSFALKMPLIHILGQTPRHQTYIVRKAYIPTPHSSCNNWLKWYVPATNDNFLILPLGSHNPLHTNLCYLKNYHYHKLNCQRADWETKHEQIRTTGWILEMFFEDSFHNWTSFDVVLVLCINWWYFFATSSEFFVLKIKDICTTQKAHFFPRVKFFL